MSDFPEVSPATSEVASAIPRGSPSAFVGIDWWTLLYDPAFLRDPYPELKRLQQLAPVHYDTASGIFFVLGHREFGLMAKATEMGRDTRLMRNGWSSQERKLRDPETYQLYSEFQAQMTNANPPDHRRMRAVYEKAFRMGDLARFLPMMEDECQKLIDTLPVGTPFDFMTKFADVLPRRISRNLFELPPEMDDQLLEWITALNAIANLMMTPDQTRDAQRALREFKAYLRDYLASRDGDPGVGFLALAAAALADGTMDEDESLNNLVTLIAGGSATPTLLGNGLLSLLRYPGQFQELRANRGLMRTAMEEMLRYEPGCFTILRVAIRDFECGGINLPAGSMAIGLMGAINRDPSCFVEPDGFDIRRTPIDHYTFGTGLHVCLGAALVRMTAQVAFTALIDRFPTIELAGEPSWWIHRSDQRGLYTLPLRVELA